GMGLYRIETTPFMDAYQLLTVAGIKSDQDLQQLTAKLKQQFPGLIIDTNDLYFPAARPRLYSRQLLSWPDEKGCADNRGHSIKVGVIDGKMNTDHPALKASPIEIKRFVSDAAEASTHATVIAVILAGSEGDLMGLMPGVTLLSAEVIEPSKYGDVASVAAMLKALSWFHQQQVRLVNLSLAGQKANSVLQMALQIASQQGMLVFVATGNDSQQAQPIYPAAFETVFAITAIDAAERLYAHANQGDFIDFAAPGVDLWTADSESAGRYRSGTSYAVPHAVAIASVLLEVNPGLSGKLLYESLKRMSKDLGEAGHDGQFGWGLLQYPFTTCH
ncbi:MAG: S8 family serine peptidase, partial [Methylophaga sp.]